MAIEMYYEKWVKKSLKHTSSKGGQLRMQTCKFTENKLFYFYFSNILNIVFVIFPIEFFTQLYVRPPPDGRFSMNQGFASSSQKILKIRYFLSARPPAPNFVSQIDANQTYFRLPPNCV